MEASVYAVNSKSCFGLHRSRISPSLGDLRKRSLAFRSGCDPLRSTKRNNNCLRLGFGSTSMGRAGGSFQSLCGSSAKARLVKAQASEGDVENVAPAKIPVTSSGSVLPYVGVACLGAILFGYHLGVVNGALEYLAKDLGIVENTVLQGKLRVPFNAYQRT